MNITQTHLKSSEINAIIENMKKQDTYLNAIISRDMLILQYCTDLNIADENGDIGWTFDIYDKYKEDIEEVLNKVDENDLLLIDECYQHETSLNVIVKEFLDEASKKIDGYTNGVDLQKVIGTLKEISNKEKNNGIQ